jgi:hypothetical protein
MGSSIRVTPSKHPALLEPYRKGNVPRVRDGPSPAYRILVSVLPVLPGPGFVPVHHHLSMLNFWSHSMGVVQFVDEFS